MPSAAATGPVPSIGVGDFVTLDSWPGDVWEVLSVRHGVAKLAVRSIHLAGRPARAVALEQLVRFDPEAFAELDEF